MSELCRQGSAPFEACNTVGPLLPRKAFAETTLAKAVPAGMKSGIRVYEGSSETELRI